MMIGQQLHFNNQWLTLRLPNPKRSPTADDSSLCYVMQWRLNIADDYNGKRVLRRYIILYNDRGDLLFFFFNYFRTLSILD